MKQSELLRKIADAMDMAEKYGICDWRKLVQIKQNDNFVALELNTISDDYCYRFPLGVVEGKPVFEGDTLWHCNREFTADGHLPDYVLDMKNPSELSWNPPKPKTLTVELLREDAEKLSGINTNVVTPVYANLAKACRKALEEQK